MFFFYLPQVASGLVSYYCYFFYKRKRKKLSRNFAQIIMRDNRLKIERRDKTLKRSFFFEFPNNLKKKKKYFPRGFRKSRAMAFKFTAQPFLTL